jgi:hypothetical protein
MKRITGVTQRFCVTPHNPYGTCAALERKGAGSYIKAACSPGNLACGRPDDHPHRRARVGNARNTRASRSTRAGPGNVSFRAAIRYHNTKRKMTYDPNFRAKQRASAAGSPPSKPVANATRRSDGRSEWQRRYDHYRNLAQQLGDIDRVTRENYWQHAEHFFRLMNGSEMNKA